MEAEEMAQRNVCCTRDLSSIYKAHIKSQVQGCTFVTPELGNKDRTQTPGARWMASQVYSVGSTPERDPVSTKVALGDG